MGIFAQGQKNPESTELWEPVPPVVTPGEGTTLLPMPLFFLTEPILMNGPMKKVNQPDGPWPTVHVTVKPGTGIIKTNADLAIASCILNGAHLPK